MHRGGESCLLGERGPFLAPLMAMPASVCEHRADLCVFIWALSADREVHRDHAEPPAATSSKAPAACPAGPTESASLVAVTDHAPRHPAPARRLRQPVRGDEPQGAPALRDVELGLDQGAGSPPAHQLLACSGVTGHRNDYQVIVGLQETDRRHPEADHACCALDDQVEQVLQVS